MTSDTGAREPSRARTAAAELRGNRNFVLFMVLRLFNILGVHMLTVAVGWHVYQLTRDPLDLGFVGLSQFAPALALFLLAGIAADRFDRRGILIVCNIAHGMVAAALLVLAAADVETIWPTFALLVVHGVARAFFLPASQAILPNLVTPKLFPNAVAYASLAMKSGMLVGPALGGLLIAVTDDLVYAANAVAFICAAIAASLISRPLAIRAVVRPGLSTILGGLGFIWRKRLVLGAISIDLVAVLFGGVVGLLPVFASDVLHVGPGGLGVMRATPAVGALAVGALIAQLREPRNMGPTLFVCLAAFALSVVVFSLSTSFIVSIAALLVYGGSDMVSVYIRQTLLQLATPDEMRGRVSAVSSISVNASNELGDFRAGLTAAWIGTVPAVLIGGLVTLGATALWWRWFPELRRIDRLDDVAATHKAEEPAIEASAGSNPALRTTTAP